MLSDKYSCKASIIRRLALFCKALFRSLTLLVEGFGAGCHDSKGYPYEKQANEE